MQFKHKLMYMVLGGLLVLSGQLLPSFLGDGATAQNGKTSAQFETVICQRLQVVDNSGKLRAQLAVMKRDTDESLVDVIQVFNEAGIPVYQVSLSPDGGRVGVSGNDGKTRAKMQVDHSPVLKGYSGFVSVEDNDGKSHAYIGAMPGGGQVMVSGNKGETMMTAGEIRVDTPSTREDPIRVSITAESEGGRIAILGNDGMVKVHAGVSEGGSGYIATFKDSNSPATGYLP